MSKPKFIVFLLFIVISTTVFSQTTIDSVGFTVDYTESYYKPRVIATYFEGAESDRFVLDDIDNYDFTWSGDLTPARNFMSYAIYNQSVEGTYQIDLEVFEIATSSTFLYSGNLTIALPERLDLLISNVFTPNGDGINDLFTIGYDGETLLSITIYTRTGTPVFESESPIIVWDGRNSSGAEMSEGTYYYILTAPVFEDVHKGFIHLYRNSKQSL